MLYGCGGLFLLDVDVHTVDFHGFVGGDEDVLHTADDTGFDKVRAVGSHLDDHIGGFQFEMLVIDDVLGMQVSISWVSATTSAFRLAASFQSSRLKEIFRQIEAR